MGIAVPLLFGTDELAPYSAQIDRIVILGILLILNSFSGSTAHPYQRSAKSN
jgi:hypothetical protein